MATVAYTNARILIDGASLHGSMNELSVEQGAEMLDDTVFGDTTRSNKGGLLTGAISGGGFVEFETGALEDIILNRIGVDGTLLAVFPNGITEGTQTERGYAMLGVIDNFVIGGSVGELLPFTFSAQTRGVVP